MNLKAKAAATIATEFAESANLSNLLLSQATACAMFVSKVIITFLLK